MLPSWHMHAVCVFAGQCGWSQSAQANCSSACVSASVSWVRVHLWMWVWVQARGMRMGVRGVCVCPCVLHVTVFLTASSHLFFVSHVPVRVRECASSASGASASVVLHTLFFVAWMRACASVCFSGRALCEVVWVVGCLMCWFCVNQLTRVRYLAHFSAWLFVWS